MVCRSTGVTMLDTQLLVTVVGGGGDEDEGFGCQLSRTQVLLNERRLSVLESCLVWDTVICDPVCRNGMYVLAISGLGSPFSTPS